MSENQQEPTSFLESLLDNIWLLLILGVGVYFVSYIIWGWVEIAMIDNIPDQIKQMFNN